MMRITPAIILFLLFLTGAESFSQDKNAGKTVPLFESDDIIHLDLRADFKAVFAATDDSTYFPAELIWQSDDGKNAAFDVEIRQRGETRRKKTTCSFAPLRLKFPKNITDGTPFEDQKTIKLVTHCNKGDAFEQNIIAEYLVYKAFNVLTDSSFKVRPALIRYISTGKKADTLQKFAFFIEREKHLAQRLKGDEIETEKVHPDRLDPFQTCLVDLFEYMIGNTDYSIYERHNMVIVSNKTGQPPFIPVPYDFDWSGLVSASYAVPNPKFNTSDVKVRIYRGLKRDRETVDRAIRLFNERKQEIYRVFESYELLEQNERKQIARYLDEFYWTINNEAQVRVEFFERARERE